jgi:HD-like signal output (HDOD) protein
MAEAADDAVTVWPKVPDAWVNILARSSPPVLKRSLDELAQFQDAIYEVPVRRVADIVESDPMLSLNMMILMGRFQTSRPTQVDNIEEALLMIGCVNFVKKAVTFPTVDALLAKRPEALLGTLRAAARARRAGMFVRQWAHMRNDRNEAACVIAALLYEITDLLAWIHAPEKMMALDQVVRENPKRKLKLTRWMEFGFEWEDLEIKLLQRFKLPDLIIAMIKPSPAEQSPSADIVARSVAFSRKLAESRDMRALQDDLYEIARMLKVPTSRLVREMKLENTPLGMAAAAAPPEPVPEPAAPPNGSNAAA